VSEKNAALTRAQTAMADLRTDALKKQNEDRKTIEELNELLFKQNQREIKSMKEALDFGGPRGVSTDAKTLSGKPVAELVALLAERESMIETLTMKFEQQRARHEAAEAQLAERAEVQQGEITRMFEEVDREKLKGPSRVVETLVSRLKAQMAEKDKRLVQLKEAIKTLEKKLVEAMQTAASRTIRSSDASRAELESGRGADDRAQKLAAKLKKTQDDLAKARERAEIAEADLKLRVQGGTRTSSVFQAPSTRGDHSREDAEAAKTANERADELEKRVKVLTAQNAKLNRMLDGEKVGSTVTQGTPAGPRSSSHIENQPPALGGGSSKEREETLARWEEGVKLRKRAETLAKKLATRTKENEELERQCAKRDRALQDVTKERNALSAKTTRLTAALEHAGSSAGNGGSSGPDAVAVKEVVDENEALHREVAALQRVVDVEQAAEIARLKRQLASSDQSKLATSAYPSNEAAELAERVRGLEGEVLTRDDAALSLRFEAEQAAARADRLQRRVDRLFKDLAEGGGVAKAPGHGKDAGGKHQRRTQELEDVVEALKKVVEKQQGELAGLRGQAAAAARGNEHARAA
jgi:centrosomal protein CEP290